MCVRLYSRHLLKFPILSSIFLNYINRVILKSLIIPISDSPIGLFQLFFFLFSFFLYIFLAVLGLHCCMQAFSSCSEQGLLFVAVHRLLTVVASLVVEHRL